MKKLITGLAFTLMLGVQFAMAEEIKVGRQVKESFQKEFAGADNVSWQMTGDFYQATFYYQGKRLMAYFEADGELRTITRYVEYKTLPLNVTKNLEGKFAEAVADFAVLEVSKSSGTSYLISLKDSKKQYLVEADASGNITILKKQKLG